MKLLLALLITFSIPHAIAFDISKMTSVGGGLIEGTEPLHAFESMTDGENKYLILKKRIGQKNGSVNWAYVDHLLIPGIDSKYRLYISMCKYNDVFSPNIIAIGKYEVEMEWSKVIKKAWIVDINIGKFKNLEINNIECINDDFNL